MANDQPAMPDDLPPSKPVQPGGGFEEKQQIPPDKEAFQSYMEQAPGKEATQTPQGPSPLDLAQTKVPMGEAPSLDSLLGQTNNIQDTLKTVQNNLNTPNLKFKHSHQKLLDTKLSEGKNQINSASEKIGANTVAETSLPAGATPVTRFLNLVTDGQNQIMEAKKKLQEISASKGKLQPAQMLLIQTNLAQAQQALEYSSVLLSKVVDAIKQIMGMQI